jgi:hypothetical protein
MRNLVVMSPRHSLHALIFLLASAFGVIFVLLSSLGTETRLPRTTTSHAVFTTMAEPVHRDVSIEAFVVEDIGIDDALVPAPGVDIPPSRAPALTDRSVSRLSEIYHGLVTPPPNA